MKKNFLILVIGFLLLIPGVEAETLFTLSETNKSIYESASIDKFYYNDNTYSCEDYSSCYQQALNLFKESGKAYYSVELTFTYGSGLWAAHMTLKCFDFSSTDSYSIFTQSSPSRLWIKKNETVLIDINSSSSCTGGQFCSFYQLYDTNFHFESDMDLQFSNFYSTNSEDNLIIKKGGSYPLLKDLLQFNSWNDYISNFSTGELTEVNLDNYEYVLLYPKDTTKKDAYDVNFQVKGMIGITPIYEYGTVEKTEISDRCNISYSEYTDYRLYILKSDLQNNAVYAIKSCQEGSSFKFKNSDFLIFYVTEDNKDDPTITIGNQIYHTIPFDKLSNSANQNEENNFIPGESGFSLSSIVDNLSSTLDGIWSSFTTFMGFVTKIFNTLPIEFRTIAITSFSVGCVLGLIKIIKG